MNQALVDRLLARGGQVSARVIEDMYRDEFWIARFGQRGRQHSSQDGDFHVTYLVQALVADDPGIFESYARWLQSVLTTRGMCTRHLAENFERLSRAIAAEVEDSGRASEILRAGVEALRYPAGPARELQDAAERLASRTNAEREDTLHLLSYAADAIALGRPELFASHAKWLASWRPQKAAAIAPLTAAIRADAALSPELKAAAERTLAAP